MEQLDLPMHYISDNLLSRYGYRAHRMPPRREARFGALMFERAKAKDDKTFNPNEYPVTPKKLVIKQSKTRSTKRRDAIIRLAVSGITAKQFGISSKQSSQKASHQLHAQKARGYIEVTGETPRTKGGGGGVNIYGLTAKGQELLKGLK